MFSQPIIVALVTSMFFSFLFTSMVAGIPAKVIGYVNGKDPSLTMKHGMDELIPDFCFLFNLFENNVSI